MNSAADTIAAEDDGTTVERPPLDDVMLAMDVVDTLRRRERMVARELDEHGRAEDLKQRLRRIYAQQGLDVPDHVIEQGVAALPVLTGFVEGQILARGVLRRLRQAKANVCDDSPEFADDCLDVHTESRLDVQRD